jgi:hypothetical protein
MTMNQLTSNDQQLDSESPQVNNAAQTGEVQKDIEEIDSSAPVTAPNKSISKGTLQRNEPVPNPLLEDPYDWEKCTVTVTYALMPDQSVSISVHNHKDEPLVKSFAEKDVLLPERIKRVMQTLQTIWPTSVISSTLALLPKSPNETDRTIIVSVRAGLDTPIVLTDTEANLALPSAISSMLAELKALLPARALKRIEKDAKTRMAPAQKTAIKTLPKPTLKPTSATPTAPGKSQLSLF